MGWSIVWVGLACLGGLSGSASGEEKGLRVSPLCAAVIRQAADLNPAPRRANRTVPGLETPEVAFEAATTGPELASAALTPPDAERSEGGWVNDAELDRAHEGLKSMWRTVFGEEIVYESLPGTDDKLLEKAKPARSLVLARGGSVPRQVLRRWVRNNELLERKAARLRERIAVTAQTLTDKKLDFEPLFFLRLVEIMRDVMRNAQIVGESRKYLEPLIRSVHQNTKAYLRSLNQGALLDKDQAELLFQLEAMTLLGVLSPELVNLEILIPTKSGESQKFRPVYSAIEDVSACALGPTTDALSPDTRAALIVLAETLAEVAGVPVEPIRENGEEEWEVFTSRGEIATVTAEAYRKAIRDQLGAAAKQSAGGAASRLGGETLQRAARALHASLDANRTGEKELLEARKQFVADRTAAETAHDLLSAIARRDQGRALVGFGNPLRDAWVTSLDEQPQLRSLIEAALDGQTTLRDPVLKQTIDFGMSPAEAAAVFGHAEIDPMLIGQYVRRAAVGRVQARAYPLALEAELDHLLARLRLANLETGVRILSSAAGAAVNHFETVYQRGVVPKEFWKALRQQISLDDGAPAIQTGPEGRRRSMPASFSRFLEAIRPALEKAVVKSDLKPERSAVSPEAETNEEARDDEEETEPKPEAVAPATGSQLLARWLILLNRQALTLQEQERKMILGARISALAAARRRLEETRPEGAGPEAMAVYREEVAAARRKLEEQLAQLSFKKAQLADATHRLVWAVEESLWDPSKDPLGARDGEQLRADAETTFLHHLYGCAPDLATFVAVDNTAALDGIRRRMNDRELTVRFQRMNPTLWERWGNSLSALGRSTRRFRRVIAWSLGILVTAGIGWYTSDWWWPTVERHVPWLRPGLEAPLDPSGASAPPPAPSPGPTEPRGDPPPRPEPEEDPERDPDRDPDDPEPAP